jgi:RimJ/RimL family protein N-acetyltransferase
MKAINYEYAHNTDLYQVYCASEPWNNYDRIHFDSQMSSAEGFTLINSKGEICGAIMFTDYRPGNDIMIHCAVHPKYHGRWLTRQIYKQVFSYVFDFLELPRCSGFAIEGLTDPTFHLRLGFKAEGCIREAVVKGGRRRALFLLGMLASERKWK